MNKVMLMGRLTRDPEMRHSQSTAPVAVARYGLAVRRPFKKEGKPDVDFINIVSFGKAAEFAEKYFKKGQQIVIVGRLQVNTWEDEAKVKHTSIDVIVEDQHFAGDKKDNLTSVPQEDVFSGNPPRREEDDDLPF